MQNSGVYVTLAELLGLRRMALRLGIGNHRSVHSALPGAVQSPARGRGIEFVEVRPYQAGDDIRSIDWRVSARTGKPFTKLYAEERERPVYIAVDQRINMFFGSRAVFKSVLAARLTSLIAWCAVTSGNRVGGLVIGDSIQPVRSSATRRSVVKLLQLVSDANNVLHAQAQSGSSLEDILRQCLVNTSAGTTISIISDFHDASDTALQSLISLGRKRKLILLKINDPLECTFPSVGRVGIGNGIETARVFISRRQQHEYQTQQAMFAQQLIDCAAKCSASLIPVSTSDDVMDVLKRYANAS